MCHASLQVSILPTRQPDTMSKSGLDYRKILEGLENIQSDSDTEPIFVLSEAIVYSYEFAPELLDNLPADIQHSGSTTPTNEERPKKSTLVDGNMVDYTEDLSYFEEVYKAWAPLRPL